MPYPLQKRMPHRGYWSFQLQSYLSEEIEKNKENEYVSYFTLWYPLHTVVLRTANIACSRYCIRFCSRDCSRYCIKYCTNYSIRYCLRYCMRYYLRYLLRYCMR